MKKYPINERVFESSNGARDFYILHCTNEWYVESFPTGTTDHAQKSMAGFSKLKTAKECVKAWEIWDK